MTGPGNGSIVGMPKIQTMRRGGLPGGQPVPGLQDLPECKRYFTRPAIHQGSHENSDHIMEKSVASDSEPKQSRTGSGRGRIGIEGQFRQIDITLRGFIFVFDPGKRLKVAVTEYLLQLRVQLGDGQGLP